MKASPRQQSLLLQVQDYDHRLARLRRQRQQIPERQQLADLQGELAEAKAAYMEAQRELDSLSADIARLESDIETVRQRRRRDDGLLAASTSPKEAQALQAEVEALEGRKAVLEDRELALMAESETAQDKFNAAGSWLGSVEDRRESLTATLLDAERDIDARIAQTAAERDGLAAELQRDVLALYEDLRARLGIGAARLRGNVSEASNMALAPAELQQIAAAPADEVVFCPGTGAILVRDTAADGGAAVE